MKKFLIISGLFLGISIIGSVIWFELAGPVLVEWHYGINFGSICDPPFVVLNPLRSTEAEQVADKFLDEIRKGNVDALDQAVSDGDRREHFRLRETELKILSWYAGGRDETRDKANIGYWIERKYDEGCHVVPARVGLTKVNDGWKVTSYNPIY